MAIILNIDTSSPVCSVCLAAHGKPVATRNAVPENKHASMLSSMIMEVLAEAGLNMADISAVALSSGPGSYTGLRIGTSVAKGICYGRRIPLIGVPTLQGLAWQMAQAHPDPNGVYIPMVDARRDDIYMAVYDVDNNMIEKDTFATASVVFYDIKAAYTVKNVYFGGTGAWKMEIICSNNEFGIVIENIICVAANISAVSYEKYITDAFEDITSFEPFYLKEFESRMKVN